jgi:transcriptional regulator with XRE-family HTH domain
VRDLIRDRIDRDGRSLVEIATIAGMSRRALGRIIAGQKPLRLVDLAQLSEALGIDRARAVIAIDILGDWTAYDDPVLCILMRLFAPVCSKVDAGPIFRSNRSRRRPRNSRTGSLIFSSQTKSRSESAGMTS